MSFRFIKESKLSRSLLEKLNNTKFSLQIKIFLFIIFQFYESFKSSCQLLFSTTKILFLLLFIFGPLFLFSWLLFSILYIIRSSFIHIKSKFCQSLENLLHHFIPTSTTIATANNASSDQKNKNVLSKKEIPSVLNWNKKLIINDYACIFEMYKKMGHLNIIESDDIIVPFLEIKSNLLSSSHEKKLIIFIVSPIFRVTESELKVIISRIKKRNPQGRILLLDFNKCLHYQKILPFSKLKNVNQENSNNNNNDNSDPSASKLKTIFSDFIFCHPLVYRASQDYWVFLRDIWKIFIQSINNSFDGAKVEILCMDDWAAVVPLFNYNNGLLEEKDEEISFASFSKLIIMKESRSDTRSPLSQIIRYYVGSSNNVKSSYFQFILQQSFLWIIMGYHFFMIFIFSFMGGNFTALHSGLNWSIHIIYKMVNYMLLYCPLDEWSSSNILNKKLININPNAFHWVSLFLYSSYSPPIHLSKLQQQQQQQGQRHHRLSLSSRSPLSHTSPSPLSVSTMPSSTNSSLVVTACTLPGQLQSPFSEEESSTIYSSSILPLNTSAFLYSEMATTTTSSNLMALEDLLYDQMDILKRLISLSQSFFIKMKTDIISKFFLKFPLEGRSIQEILYKNMISLQEENKISFVY